MFQKPGHSSFAAACLEILRPLAGSKFVVSAVCRDFYRLNSRNAEFHLGLFVKNRTINPGIFLKKMGCVPI